MTWLAGEALGSDPDEIRRRARAALDVLLAVPSVDPSEVAAVGFCFGETVVMELARTGADIKAIVGFHPGLNVLRRGDSRHIRGKVLMCVGADDPIVNLEQRIAFEEEMRSCRVDSMMHVFGGRAAQLHQSKCWVARLGRSQVRTRCSRGHPANTACCRLSQNVWGVGCRCCWVVARRVGVPGGGRRL